MDSPITEGEILAALSRRYAAPSWAFFPHFAGEPGRQGTRIVDGMAIGTQAATAFEIIGFEVKLNRADWLREKRDWTKAHAVGRYCDRWYLVIPKDEALVKPDELHPTWGLLVYDGHVLHEKVKARHASAIASPDRAFVASLARQTMRKDPDAELIKGREKAAYDRGYASGRHTATADASVTQGKLQRLEDSVARFEAKCDLRIQHPDSAERLGEAVAIVQAGGVEQALRRMNRLAELAGTMKNALDEQLAIATSFMEGRTPC